MWEVGRFRQTFASYKLWPISFKGKSGRMIARFRESVMNCQKIEEVGTHIWMELSIVVGIIKTCRFRV
jgi:hypothetical protein